MHSSIHVCPEMDIVSEPAILNIMVGAKSESMRSAAGVNACFYWGNSVYRNYLPLLGDAESTAVFAVGVANIDSFYWKFGFLLGYPISRYCYFGLSGFLDIASPFALTSWFEFLLVHNPYDFKSWSQNMVANSCFGIN